MTSITPHIIAIDWSGARDRADQKIWLAEATADGEVVRLEAGRDRAAVAEHLMAEARHNRELIVGLDFAFSLPAWFLTERGLHEAPALWELVEREGERWLAACEPPFWGRMDRPRPEGQEHLRRTERHVPDTAGVRPKSVFQINGGGSVGTGSLRGMPILKQLWNAGFSVWPFDAPRLPMIVEIYPRVLTGPMDKANTDERRHYLESNYPELARDIIVDATESDDAFDALVSALVMATHATQLASLLPAADPLERLEGKIWLPGMGRQAANPARGRYNSSKTRVAPVFTALEAGAGEDPQWLRCLLDLVAGERSDRPWHTQDLTVQTSHFEPNERPLQPPLALLSWLVRNLDAPAAKLRGDAVVTRERRKLAAKDPATIERALELLRQAGTGRGWTS